MHPSNPPQAGGEILTPLTTTLCYSNAPGDSADAAHPHAPSAVANTTNETRNNFLFILKIALNYDATESQSVIMPIKIACQLHRNAIWRNEIKLCKTRTAKIKPHQDADVRKTDCRDDGKSKMKLNLDARPEINSNS